MSDHPCECGCGSLTRLAPFTHAAKGWVAGQPLRFVSGHYVRPRGPQTPLADRFWRSVDRRGPDECWPWKDARDAHGYGAFGHGSKTLKAHRVSSELTDGPIAEGLAVCHRCDNPPCCNPAHLFRAPQPENVRDMFAKGRGNPGGRRVAC